MHKKRKKNYSTAIGYDLLYRQIYYVSRFDPRSPTVADAVSANYIIKSKQAFNLVLCTHKNRYGIWYVKNSEYTQSRKYAK